jgi:nucleotide-binding universal stress UspA family protein
VRTVLEYADDHGIDQIVLGSHGRSGIDRMLLGSVAETVTRRARIPVTVIG